MTEEAELINYIKTVIKELPIVKFAQAGYVVDNYKFNFMMEHKSKYRKDWNNLIKLCQWLNCCINRPSLKEFQSIEQSCKRIDLRYIQYKEQMKLDEIMEDFK